MAPCSRALPVRVLDSNSSIWVEADHVNPLHHPGFSARHRQRQRPVRQTLVVEEEKFPWGSRRPGRCRDIRRLAHAGKPLPDFITTRKGQSAGCSVQRRIAHELHQLLEIAPHPGSRKLCGHQLHERFRHGDGHASGISVASHIIIHVKTALSYSYSGEASADHVRFPNIVAVVGSRGQLLNCRGPIDRNGVGQHLEQRNIR